MIWPRPDEEGGDDAYESECTLPSSISAMSRLHLDGPLHNRVDYPVALSGAEATTPPSAQRVDLDILPLSQLVTTPNLGDAGTSSPAWSHRESSSPCIPSAQPPCYPFSLPSSGIRPLTPLSPLRGQQSEYDLEHYSMSSSSSEYSDVSDSVLDAVIQGMSRVQVE